MEAPEKWISVMANWLDSNPDLDSSTVFSHDEYGLLNAAKFALLVFSNDSSPISSSNCQNESLFEEAYQEQDLYSVGATNDSFEIAPAHIVSKSPSIYNMWEIIILSVIITTMMIVIVVGNMLGNF